MTAIYAALGLVGVATGMLAGLFGFGGGFVYIGVLVMVLVVMVL
jgi:hypothetical protein